MRIRHTFPPLLLALLACCAAARAGEGIVIRENPRKFKATVTYEVKPQKSTPRELWVVLPVPDDNGYQDIRRIGNAPGAVGSYPETGGKYYHVQVIGGDRQTSPPFAAKHEFYVTAYDLRTDFSRIGAIHSYNKTSDIYKRFTGKTAEYIDPSHPAIVRIATDLGKNAKNDLDFARRAYEYVAKNYKYIEADTGGFKPLDQILQQGGGQCGNLSSIYISLLRRRGIPARHLVGYRTNGKPHVYADFYLERYGWIPVDVTWAGTTKLKKDYFGRIHSAHPTVILSHGADLTIPGHDGNVKRKGMQKGSYWWRSRKGKPGKIDVNYSFVCARVEE